MKKQIIILGCFFVLLFFTFGCIKPLQPTYLGYENLRLGKVGVKNNIVLLDLKFYNPNRYALKVKEAETDIFFNDTFLGHSSMNSFSNLPPLDTTLVPFSVKASATDILVNTAQIFLNPNVRVKIQGNVKVGGGRFYVNIPIAYQGTQYIQLSRTIQLSKVVRRSYKQKRLHRDG